MQGSRHSTNTALHLAAVAVSKQMCDTPSNCCACCAAHGALQGTGAHVRVTSQADPACGAASAWRGRFLAAISRQARSSTTGFARTRHSSAPSTPTTWCAPHSAECDCAYVSAHRASYAQQV